MYQFDVENKAWVEVGNMSTARGSHAASVVARHWIDWELYLNKMSFKYVNDPIIIGNEIYVWINWKILFLNF